MLNYSFRGGVFTKNLIHINIYLIKWNDLKTKNYNMLKYVNGKRSYRLTFVRAIQVKNQN